MEGVYETRHSSSFGFQIHFAASQKHPLCHSGGKVFYIWELIYRCCLHCKLAPVTSPNGRTAWKFRASFTKICMSQFCQHSEELDLTSTSDEGPSEGKIITTDHSKQRHLGSSKVLGANEDYRLSSNTSWEKAEEAWQKQGCQWVTLYRKTEMDCNYSWSRSPKRSKAAWHSLQGGVSSTST